MTTLVNNIKAAIQEIDETLWITRPENFDVRKCNESALRKRIARLEWMRSNAIALGALAETALANLPVKPAKRGKRDGKNVNW